MDLIEMSNALESAKATEQIVNSIRDLCNLKITLPLGNPNLKLVHTNQFLFTELPEDVFELANMDVIGDALDSSYSRYSGYVQNRWYVEATTITNDGVNRKIEIELNPFATDFNNFKDEYQSFQTAYTDAVSSNQTSTNTGKSTVKSVKKKVKLPGGEGATIDKLAKKIVGNESNELKRAKKIHEWALKNLGYSFYKNCKYCSVNSCYKNRKKLNCADTSILVSAIMRSAGVDCYVVHSKRHYYVVIIYKGKLYCSDPVCGKRKFNYYWTPSNSYTKFKGKSSYISKCGKKPC